MKNNISIVGLLSLGLIGLFAISLMFIGGGSQDVQAAVPTVVAAVDAGTGKGVVIPFQATTALIADTATTPIEILNFKTVDIEFVIDQHATVVNTTTLTVQYSIGGTVWEDGVVLANANAADANDLLVRVPIYGRWIRVNQDVATTDPITISITSVARP